MPELVWHVLREDAHRMQSVGTDGAVMRALKVEFRPKQRRKFTRSGRRERFPPLLLRKCSITLPEVMGFAEARARMEVRQVTEKDIRFDRAPFKWNLLYPIGPCRRGIGAQQA